MSIYSDDSNELMQKTDGYFEKLISVRRNAKVVKGGRIFCFSVHTVVGDGNGRVGVGKGRAREVSFAIQKAMEKARSNLISVVLNKDTIHHEIRVKYCATKIIMLPASEGTGIIAGGAMRSVFEAVGIKNVLAKCFGSTDPCNVVKATLKGLLEISNSVKINSFRKDNFC